MTTAPANGKRAPQKSGQPTPPPPAPGPSAAVLTPTQVEARHVAAYGAAVGGEVALPNLRTGMDAKRLPIVRSPRPAFILLWSASCWQVSGKNRRVLVPALNQIRLTGGVSGVIVGRDGSVDLNTHARANWEERGYRAIPTELGPGGSYLRKHRVDPSGDGKVERIHWATAWEQFYSGTNSSTHDEDGYNTWILALVAAGHIPPCPLPMAVKLADKARTRIARLQTQIGQGQTIRRSELATAEQDLAVLESYIATFDGAVYDEAPPDAPEAEGEVAGLDGVLHG
jgi:hypothetical protein